MEIYFWVTLVTLLLDILYECYESQESMEGKRITENQLNKHTRRRVSNIAII